MHAHAHSIVLSYAHALDLTRADAVTVTCAANPDLIQTLDLTRARAVAEAIDRDLATAIDLAHTSAIDLAAAIDLDLSILSAFEFDLDRVLDIGGGHAANLDSAYTLARGIPRATGLDLASILGLASLDTLDPALPLPGFLGLPLRWVADGPLAGTLLQVLAANSQRMANARPLASDPCQTFALGLVSRAGMHETTPLRAALGSPLISALRGLTATGPAAGDGSPWWNQATGISRLTDACAPMCGTHRPPDPAQAAALRAVALALADGAAVSSTTGSTTGSPTTGSSTTGSRAGAPGVPDVLRTVAATVTLVENRAKGKSSTGESVILALA